jgi:hypothetical protein
MKIRPFAEARDYVHSLGLKSFKEWRQYCKSDKKDDDIPTYPDVVYKKIGRIGEIGLGTGFIANRNKVFRPFEEAREYAHSLGLKSQGTG